MSAAKFSCDHIHDWFTGTKPRENWSGSYGIPAGIIYSFPVTVENGEWKIVQGLAIDDFSRGKMDATLGKELEGERDEALAACQ